MDIEQKLTHQAFLNRELSISHLAYERENAFFNSIQEGNVAEMQRLYAPLGTSNMGRLSDNPLRNLQYHLIQSVAQPIATYIGAEAIINVASAIEDARDDPQLSKAGYYLQRAKDNTHLAVGLPMYIASLCYAYVLLGVRPDDISFYPAGSYYSIDRDWGKKMEDGFVLTEDLARKARELTWKAVETSVK